MSFDSVQEMVERIASFSPIDYEILIFFESHDIQSSPKVTAANIGYDSHYAGKRLRKMTEVDIFERVDEGLYQLTDFGRRLIDSDLTDEEVEQLEQALADG